VFHQWLTPEQFANRFGPRPDLVEEMAYWLRDAGLRVLSANPADGYIRVAMTVAQAKRVFGVTIGASKDGRHYANLNDPAIPARFAPLVSSIVGLDNLMRVVPLIRHTAPPVSSRMEFPDALVRLAAFTDDAAPATPESVVPSARIGGTTAFGPQDIRNFYDAGPLLSKGISGAGGCIALVEDSDYLDSAVSLFDSTFGLPGPSLSRVFASGGTNPGRRPGFEGEALLDIEWAHAVAPAAPISVVIGAPAPKGDILDSMRNVVKTNTCGIMSISFSFCNAPNAFYTSTLDTIFAQGASQGISTFLSTGDNGVDTCLSHTANISEMAADPSVTAVGGTQFTPTYDASGIDVGWVSEQVWNTPGGGSGGGGVSKLFAKPSYQSGVTPADGHRDIPDISMIASPAAPGVFLGDDDGTGTAVLECCWGGTSLAAPVFAAFVRLASQSASNVRYGNLNPAIYGLGPKENSSAVGLRDVKSGSNTFNGVPGFSATTGYDLASGWGTADMAQLAPQLNGVQLPVNVKLGIKPAKLAFGNVVYGATGATSAPKIVTITNPKGGKSPATVAIGTITASPGFNQSNNCGSLAPGSSCKINVTMTPLGLGPIVGTLTIPNNTQSGTATVALKGAGVAGKLKISPLKLAFGRNQIGVQSPAKTVTLMNPNSVGLVINSVSASAGYNATGCVGSLPAHGSCPISVTFTATAKGAQPGTLTINDDAAHSPQTVKLTGAGK
jgi:subtilase family serine protease